MTEHAIQNDIRNALARPELRTFRANTGQAWTGSECIRQPNGDMLIKNARPFSTGLPKGFPDLFGFRRHAITAEDIGKVVALFYSIEVKTPKGVISQEQQAFIDAATKCGARAGVARSVEDAERIVFGAGHEQG